MQMQGEIEDLRSSPSFKCYSFDSITSTAIAKVIRETEDEEFEFKLLQNDDESSLKDIDSQNWTVFPVFNCEFQVNNEAHTVIKPKHHETDTLKKLFNDQPEESSLEADELEGLPSGTFCVWRPTNCEKSSSTGSGSKGWIIRYLLQWSMCDDKEPVLLLTPKQKRRSSEDMKAGTAVQERFYVRRRAEKEEGKRKSYLPYRKDLVGLSFASLNGMAKMLPF